MIRTPSATPWSAACRPPERRPNPPPMVFDPLLTFVEGRVLPGALMQHLAEARLEPPPQDWELAQEDCRSLGREPQRAENHTAATALRHPREWLWLFGRFLALSLRPIERLLMCVQSWQERSRSRRDLRALSDHQLKDLGLSRADVEPEASKRFWRE